MKTFAISGLLAFGVLSAAAFVWLMTALALSRWRGRQVARWLREHEAAEWPERPIPPEALARLRRKVAIQFHHQDREQCEIARRA